MAVTVTVVAAVVVDAGTDMASQASGIKQFLPNPRFVDNGGTGKDFYDEEQMVAFYQAGLDAQRQPRSSLKCDRCDDEGVLFVDGCMEPCLACQDVTEDVAAEAEHQQPEQTAEWRAAIENSLDASGGYSLRWKAALESFDRTHKRCPAQPVPFKIVDIKSAGFGQYANFIYTGPECPGLCVAMIPGFVAAALRKQFQLE